jgi:hypothetical protein
LLLLQGLNWGNGFVTDKALIEEWKITDANPFFQALMERPYLDRVVISPHLYGPSVSHRKDFYKVGQHSGEGKGVCKGCREYRHAGAAERRRTQQPPPQQLALCRPLA